MSLLTDGIKKNLPLRISLIVSSAISLLLMVLLLFMLYYSRKSMKEDALNRASNSLEQAMTNIDNILLSVEETIGNTYYRMHLDKPELLPYYSQKITETNPYISHCVIALDGPDNPYKEENWFTQTMKSKKGKWIVQPVDTTQKGDRFISICLPLYKSGNDLIGVIRSDVSLTLLFNLIAKAKPSANSYCMLLDNDGSLIIGPDELQNFDINELLQDKSIHHAFKAMTSGKEGYVPFSFFDSNFLLFYQPFELVEVPYRIMEDMHWSIGVAYFEEDIVGDFFRLFNLTVIFAIVGIALLYLHIRLILTHRLKPLKRLTEQAEHIAQGNYNEPFNDRANKDEIGMLQRHFKVMKDSVATQVSELDALNGAIKERSKELQKAYKEAEQANKLKTIFLHNMTNQMIEPTMTIRDNVNTLSQYNKETSEESLNQLVDSIIHKSQSITKLLSQMITATEQEMKEEKGGEA